MAVPLALAEKVAALWPALQELAQCGNVACRSDLQVRGAQPPTVGEQRGGSLGIHRSTAQGVLAGLGQQSPFVHPALRMSSKDFI